MVTVQKAGEKDRSQRFFVSFFFTQCRRVRRVSVKSMRKVMRVRT